MLIAWQCVSKQSRKSTKIIEYLVVSNSGGIPSHLPPFLPPGLMFSANSTGLHFFILFFKAGKEGRSGRASIFSAGFGSLLKKSKCIISVSIVKNTDFPSQLQCLQLKLLLVCKILACAKIPRKFM